MRRYLYPLLIGILWISLVLIGIVAVNAAAYTPGARMIAGVLTPKAVKVLIFAAASLLVSAAVLAIPAEKLIESAEIIHLLVSLMVLAVLVYGKVSHGAQRWIQLGPVSIQPSEFLKLSLILLGVKELKDEATRSLIKYLVGFALPAGLVLLQPDLGTTIVLYFIFFVQVTFWGLNPFLLGGLSALIGAIGFRFLHDYQRKRILTFLNPYSDPYGAGWNVIQSMNAIGNGGLKGKGLFKGNLTNLGFVPERSTDFIMAVIGEELGFMGVATVLSLEALLIMVVLKMSLEMPKVGRLVGIGTAAYLFIHAFENSAMCVSMMPVTGLTMPLISYGGSSMLTTTLLLALVVKFYLSRDELKIYYELSKAKDEEDTL